MKVPQESTEPDIRIELIPLIDVIFCILTFFILAAVTLTRQNAINVDLPSAASGQPQMREMLLVTVDPIGQVFIDQTPVTREQLYQALLAYQQGNPQGLMVLNASKLASYNDVLQVLDVLKEVGGSRVALATLPDQAGQDSGTSDLLPGLQGQPNSTFDPLDPSNPFGAPGGLTDPFNPQQPDVPRLQSPVAPQQPPTPTAPTTP
jgi:biopolymer transport protein ExbD